MASGDPQKFKLQQYYDVDKKSLNLDGVHLKSPLKEEQDYRSIFEQVARVKGIKINFSNNPITQKIFDLIIHQQNLNFLILNGIDFQIFKSFSSLNQNTTLTHLNLSNSLLGNDQFELLCNALHQNSTLEVLECQSCKISSLIPVSPLLKKNNCLNTLNLSENLIGDTELLHLLDALPFNNYLIHLNLLGNPITSNGVKQLNQACLRNQLLTEIHIEDANLSEDFQQIQERNEELFYFEAAFRIIRYCDKSSIRGEKMKNRMPLSKFLQSKDVTLHLLASKCQEIELLCLQKKKISQTEDIKQKLDELVQEKDELLSELAIQMTVINETRSCLGNLLERHHIKKQQWLKQNSNIFLEPIYQSVQLRVESIRVFLQDTRHYEAQLRQLTEVRRIAEEEKKKWVKTFNQIQLQQLSKNQSSSHYSLSVQSHDLLNKLQPLFSFYPEIAVEGILPLYLISFPLLKDLNPEAVFCLTQAQENEPKKITFHCTDTGNDFLLNPFLHSNPNTDRLHPTIEEYNLQEPKDAARFQNLVYWLNLFDHPNIIKPIRVDRKKSKGFIYYPTFKNVFSWREQENPTFAQLKDFFQKCLNVFRLFEKENILHNNICPENIYVNEKLEPIISGFEFTCKRNFETIPELNSLSSVYSSPEIRDTGSHLHSSKSDCFSFALFMLKCLDPTLDVKAIETGSRSLGAPQGAHLQQPSAAKLYELIFKALQPHPYCRPNFQDMFSSLKLNFEYRNDPLFSKNRFPQPNLQLSDQVYPAIFRPVALGFVVSLPKASPSYWAQTQPHSDYIGLVDDTEKYKNQFAALMNYQMNEYARETGIGLDAHSEIFQRFEVKKVERIENITVWNKYANERQVVLNQLTTQAEILSMNKINYFGEQACPDFIESLSPQKCINEVFLFHCPKQENTVISSIVCGGCDERYCKRGAFGAGIYFAEHAVKSDQYARTSPLESGEKTYKMLVCRVILGLPFVQWSKITSPTDRFPPIRSGITTHSTISECTKTSPHGKNCNLKRFREFLIHKREQIYPEFCITYTRQQ